jgi:hypothetical protein
MFIIKEIYEFLTAGHKKNHKVRKVFIEVKKISVLSV